MQQTTEEELSKLRNTIVEEGINKKNYSDEESDIDSDDELVMKFVNHKNKKSDFETTAYAFALNNKMSKTRSELARCEERMRYLQLDYNNLSVKMDEQKALNSSLRTKNAHLFVQNRDLSTKYMISKFIIASSLVLHGLIILNGCCSSGIVLIPT
jgi:hypothetical protein